MKLPTLRSVQALSTVIPLAYGTVLSTPADAATSSQSVQALLARAVHNTNTVTSLVHHDVTTITLQNLTVHTSSRGTEDEAHDREQDSESVLVRGKTSSGKTKILRYTVDLVFMNGVTYYRTSLTKNVWRKHAGMAFRDPYTGGFKRGRTTITYPKSAVFKQVGVAGNETHVRAAVKSAINAETIDLWIRHGSTPYVVRQDLYYRGLKGNATSETTSMSLGPFNTQTVIQAPTTGGST